MSKKKRRGVFWTPEEDQILAAHKATRLVELARILKRTVRSVSQRKVRIGLSKPKLSASRVPTALVFELAAQFAAMAECAPEDVLGPSRRMRIVWARQQIMKALRSEYSLFAIARALGVDHSTIHYGVARADRPCPPPDHERTARTHRARAKFEKIRARSVRLILNHRPPPPPAPTPPPAVIESDFIRPLSKAELMRGRA